MTASLFLLVTVGLAAISRYRIGWLRGSTIAAAIVLAFAGAVSLAAVRYIFDTRTSTEWWATKRDIRSRLLRNEGDDLVFVRYGPSHNVHTEWVYNGSSIDAQPIVWAREIDPDSDAQLRAYFDRRKAWVVMADEVPPRIVPWKASIPRR